jgi:hypothetical protein
MHRSLFPGALHETGAFRAARPDEKAISPVEPREKNFAKRDFSILRAARKTRVSRSARFTRDVWGWCGALSRRG